MIYQQVTTSCITSCSKTIPRDINVTFLDVFSIAQSTPRASTEIIVGAVITSFCFDRKHCVRVHTRRTLSL